MKKIIFLVCALSMLLFVSCNSESDPINTEDSITSVSPKSSNTASFSIMGNPNRANYDIVIMDIDRWEICLNVNRSRRNVTSYGGNGSSILNGETNLNSIADGCLWYQAGRTSFEGKATATYDPIRDIVTIVAYDAGWDKGHIFYTLNFIEGSNKMEGTFCYFESPRRVNWVDAWLVQGTIGTHTAGAALAKTDIPDSVPAEHPKKARFESNE